MKEGIEDLLLLFSWFFEQPLNLTEWRHLHALLLLQLSLHLSRLTLVTRAICLEHFLVNQATFLLHDLVNGVLTV